MLVVGLTGGIATGKSTVSSLLAAKHVPIVDADVIARRVVAPGTPALARIAKHFSSEILLEDGSLDRKKLGDIIFNDPEKRKVLNGIVHPAVRWEMLKQVVGYWVRGYKYVVLDVPLLIEGPMWKWVGLVVVVYCSEPLQLQRLLSRDTSTPTAARARLASQIPISQKIPYADIVLDNSGSRAELETQVDELVEKMEREAGWWWVVSWVCPPVGVLSAVWVVLWRRVRFARRMRGRGRGRGDGKEEKKE